MNNFINQFLLVATVTLNAACGFGLEKHHFQTTFQLENRKYYRWLRRKTGRKVLSETLQ